MNSQELAKKVRENVVEMAYLSKASHVASALSMVDILAVLYTDIININPQKCHDINRDRFVLSKGHGSAALYAILAHKGFFDVEMLKEHYADGSKLSGHVSHKGLDGIEVSTGSLGHGISIATGLALNAKLDKSNYKVYVLIGDGECDEGTVWEACLFAAHHKLDNLTIIIDRNKLQALGYCEDVLNLNSYIDKFTAFGLDTIEINGHNHDELRNAFLKNSNGKPKCIIADTIKGYGVSFMENKLEWHYRNPNKEDYEKAISEIRGK